jgi:hypothetical protein
MRGAIRRSSLLLEPLADAVSAGRCTSGSEAIYLNGNHLGPAVHRFLFHSQELRTYLANNESAFFDDGAGTGPGDQSQHRALKHPSMGSPTPAWPNADACVGRREVRIAWQPCVLRCWTPDCTS